MTIDWMHFSPWSSAIGGVLIGAAASMFILLNGRIAAVSGIVRGLLVPTHSDWAWRLAFLAGLLLAPAAWLFFAPPVVPRIEAGTGTIVVAGLFVGLGASYGSGCTSGHGVCGLSRLSARSIVATFTFMLTGFATVFAVRHMLV